MIQTVFRCGGRDLDLSAPQVMGILNLTPDSFSDGGKYRAAGGEAGFFVSVDSALRSAEEMQQQGAAFVDVGGESTRPGSVPVSVQQELDRVIPVVEAISQRLDVLISVDTSTAQVITEAAGAGAALINDVRALQREGALEAAVASRLSVCLMHMKGQPQDMQQAPVYENVLEEVYSFLEQRLRVCRDAGIGKQRLMVDPGFGFGKTLEHNYTLLRNLRRFTDLGVPVLAGMSRKSMLGSVLNKPVDQRLAGGLAAAVYAVMSGAAVVRTHDVAATVDALKICAAIHAQPVMPGC